jgi:hypothetical protein
VRSGVIADDVDNGHLALARVVQIGQSIAQSAAEVQQGCRRLARHARIAVSSASGNALEQGQHRTHAWLVIECRDEVHFRGAGIAETGGDAGIDQRADQGIGAIGHRGFLSLNFRGRSG